MGGRIRIGISACLLGREVRWDGNHARDRFLVETLGRWVEYVPVCPEVEAGFGVPREPMRLVGDPAAPRLVTVRGGVDHTARMEAWARRRVAELADEGLSGFIFKSGSPSSGMERVKVYPASGVAVRKGVGLFARAFMERFPLVPVEEEGRLNDPALRETFIEAVFTLERWRETLGRARTRGGLVEFHTRHKLLLMAHSPVHYRAMGKLVGEGRGTPTADLFARYGQLLGETLRRPATVKKHLDVLTHMLGYFKKELSADEKQEVLETLASYRAGLLPLIVPVTLLAHHVRRVRQPYLAAQWYLAPHPLELQLRNHV